MRQAGVRWFFSLSLHTRNAESVGNWLNARDTDNITRGQLTTATPPFRQPVEREAIRRPEVPIRESNHADALSGIPDTLHELMMAASSYPTSDGSHDRPPVTSGKCRFWNPKPRERLASQNAVVIGR